MYFSPDGSRLALFGADSIEVWEVPTGTKVSAHKLPKQFSPVVAFSGDGRLLAAGDKNLEKAGHPGEIMVWDIKSGKELLTLNGHGDAVSTLAFRPDGKVIASGAGDSTVRLWDVATGKQLHRLEGPDGSLNHVAFSADGRLLAATGWHTGVWLFDAHTARKLRILKCEHVCGEVSFSPDGKFLAASDDAAKRVRVWESGSGRRLADFPKEDGPREYISELAFTPGGNHLVSCDVNQTVLWEARTGKVLWRWKMDNIRVHKAISPDGRWLAVPPAQSPDGQLLPGESKIRIWRLDSGQK